MLKRLSIIQKQTVFNTVLREWEKSTFCNACFQTWFVITMFLKSYLQTMFLEFDSPWVDTKRIRSRMEVSYRLVKKIFRQVTSTLWYHPKCVQNSMTQRMEITLIYKESSKVWLVHTKTKQNRKPPYHKIWKDTDRQGPCYLISLG